VPRRVQFPQKSCQSLRFRLRTNELIQRPPPAAQPIDRQRFAPGHRRRFGELGGQQGVIRRIDRRIKDGIVEPTQFRQVSAGEGASPQERGRKRRMQPAPHEP